ncbi:MAG: 3,4-dihydroxy-2-butanone-4-phosphate synthase [Deltaproteobacteria bacterium RBG_16_71_12]|nr:MAG: 3,4-dihydroxy-2-butanone-4-phosphate synthase [Deltaproteobacteria bacterium RBG_16_71_12]
MDALARGKAVILVDDEDRENEGDLVIAAEKTTPELINFMAREGRGLICLTLTDERLQKLDLPPMVEKNTASLGTAFTVSIEAKEGVTTGISAADRARTVQVAIDDASGPADLVRPGHVFPLRAQPGGVLVRTGQTEGSVDLCRLAGLKPAGVICEILNDDGTMARLPDLVTFAERHGTLICSIADVIAFRLQHESLVERAALATVDTPYGQLRAMAFRGLTRGPSGLEPEALALVRGTDEEIHAASSTGVAPLVRVHSGDPLTDVFGGILDKGGLHLHASIRQVAAEPVGVILYLPKEPEPARIVDALNAVEAARHEGKGLPERDRAPKGHSPVVRHYGTGAQILRSLGITRMRLLTNNPVRLNALRGFGIEITESVPIDVGGAR